MERRGVRSPHNCNERSKKQLGSSCLVPGMHPTTTQQLLLDDRPEKASGR